MALTVFVTGADRGLGRALARAFADRGDRVFAGLHQATDPGPGIQGLALEVTSQASVEACAREIAATAGHVDLVVNNAAVLGPMDQGTDPVLDYQAMLRTFDVNALGALRVCHAFLPLLERGTEKLVVNISSEAGSIAQCQRDGWFGYGMSKAALNMASAQVHNVLKPLGGRVLVLHPGWVRTWMQGKLDEGADLGPEESAAALLAVIEARGAEVHASPLFLQWDGKALPW